MSSRNAQAASRTRLVVLAPAKINLGLEILRRRPDGFHEIVTLLQAVKLTDRVVLEVSPEPGIRLTVRPRGVDLGPEEENLAVRAARLIPPDHGRTPGLHIELTKRIPVGAGMGGGSADAAAVLVGLNHLRGGGRSPDCLEELASLLGSDVPFFIRGGTQLATGRGEKLQQAPPWPSKPLVLVYPNRPVSTRSAYELATFGLTPSKPLSSISFSGFPPDFWSRQEQTLRNDLEDVVARLEPTVAGILRELRDLGSGFVRVTGSGSGVFAVAPDGGEAEAWVQRFQGQGYWSRRVYLSRGGCVIHHR